MKKKTIVILSAAGAVILMVAFLIYAGREKGNTYNVRVETVKRQDIISSITASGVVEEVKRKDIYAEQPLKVKKIYIKKGESVEPGQKLLEYDMDQIEAQYRELLEAKKAQENNARRAGNINRSEEHMRTAVLPANGYDLGLLQQNGAAGFESSLGVQGGQTITSQIPDAALQKDNMNTVKLKINDIEKLMKKIKDSSVSSISGVVSELSVVEGGYASVQVPVMRIVDTKNLQVRANIKEFDIREIQVGQEVYISGDAIDPSEKVKGKVGFIFPVARRNRTATGEETLVEVIIPLDRHYDKLIPGLSTSCRIVTAKKTKVPVVSFMALKEDKDGNKSLFTVNKNGVLESRRVRLGISSEMGIEVLEGIKEGEKVVINWKPDFKPGNKAKITEEIEK